MRRSRASGRHGNSPRFKDPNSWTKLHPTDGYRYCRRSQSSLLSCTLVSSEQLLDEESITTLENVWRPYHYGQSQYKWLPIQMTKKTARPKNIDFYHARITCDDHPYSSPLYDLVLPSPAIIWTHPECQHDVHDKRACISLNLILFCLAVAFWCCDCDARVFRELTCVVEIKKTQSRTDRAECRQSIRETCQRWSCACIRYAPSSPGILWRVQFGGWLFAVVVIELTENSLRPVWSDSWNTNKSEEWIQIHTHTHTHPQFTHTHNIAYAELRRDSRVEEALAPVLAFQVIPSGNYCP